MASQIDQQSMTPTETIETDVTIAIVERVAAEEDVDPVELPPLQTAIDADALAALTNHSSGSSELTVQFSYCGYTVTVTGEGAVSLSG